MIPSIAFVSALIGMPAGPVCVVTHWEPNYMALSLVTYTGADNALYYMDGYDTRTLDIDLNPHRINYIA